MFYNRTSPILNIKTGSVIKLMYQMFDCKRDIQQPFQGLIIATKKNKTFILRQSILNIGVEHIFYKFSPRILSVVLEKKIVVSRSKLYFTRSLQLDKFLI